MDVAIVGGGYTGLWTAYYLAKADPSLRIAVLEREVIGIYGQRREPSVTISDLKACRSGADDGTNPAAGRP